MTVFFLFNKSCFSKNYVCHVETNIFLRNISPQVIILGILLAQQQKRKVGKMIKFFPFVY